MLIRVKETKTECETMKKKTIDELFEFFFSLTLATIDLLVSLALFGSNLIVAGVVASVNILLLPFFIITTFDEAFRDPKESIAYGVSYLAIIDFAIVYTYSTETLPPVLLATALILTTLVLYWLDVKAEESGLEHHSRHYSSSS